MLAGWGLAATLFYTRYLLSIETPTLLRMAQLVPLWVICCGGWSLLTPALGWLIWRWPLYEVPGRGRLERLAHTLGRLALYAAVGGAVVAATIVNTRFGNTRYLTAIGLSAARYQAPVTSHTVFLDVLLCTAVIVTLSASARREQARKREQELARLKLERLELENGLRDAELQALRMKINPHFLFNALQTVSALVRSDPRAAERMLARVGDVLRMALRLDLTAEITLQEELDVALAYLDLEKVRFRDRLHVAVDVEPGLADALVPSLILQPLVENAIRHGVSRKRGAAELRIEARREDSTLRLAILDNGAGFELTDEGEVEPGIGLGVVRARLEKLYPGAAGCHLSNQSGGGAAVELRFPLRRAESRSGHAA